MSLNTGTVNRYTFATPSKTMTKIRDEDEEKQQKEEKSAKADATHHLGFFETAAQAAVADLNTKTTERIHQIVHAHETPKSHLEPQDRAIQLTTGAPLDHSLEAPFPHTEEGLKKPVFTSSSLIPTPTTLKGDIKGELSHLKSSAMSTADHLKAEAEKDLHKLEASAKSSADYLKSKASSLEGSAKSEYSSLKSSAKSELSSLEGSTKSKMASLKDSAKSEYSSLEGSAKSTMSSLKDSAISMEKKIESKASSLSSSIKTAPARRHDEFPTETAVAIDRAETLPHISSLSSASEIPSSPSHKEPSMQGGLFGGLFNSIKGAASTVSHALHLDGSSSAPSSPSMRTRIEESVESMLPAHHETAKTAPSHYDFPTEVAVIMNQHDNVEVATHLQKPEAIVDTHPTTHLYEVREVDSPSTMHALHSEAPADIPMSTGLLSGFTAKIHDLMNTPSTHKEFASDLAVYQQHKHADESMSTRSA